MSLPFIVVLATAAAAGGDILWYGFGRRGGPQVVSFFDRLSGNKKAYFDQSIRFVKTYGIVFLVISKFIPGLASLACPAAGMANMPLSRFLLFDLLSRALWAASVSCMGYSGIYHVPFLQRGL
jgi:membrane protein DedA with SNARE-associated domain